MASLASTHASARMPYLVATRLDATREVHLLFTHQQKSAIVAAYNGAQSAGRQFIEQTIREIDPSAVESLRAKSLHQINFRLRLKI